MASTEKNITALKLKLLCHGARIDDALKPGLLPRYRFKRASLSEGRNFKISTNGKKQSTVINLAVYEKYVENSPFEYDHNRNLLLENGDPVCAMEIVSDPAWYLDRLEDGTLFGSYIQLHGVNVLATSLANYCVFKEDGQGCEFCGMTLDPDNMMKNPEILARILKAIMDQNPEKYHELNINSGTLRSGDMGSQMFINAIKEVKKVSDVLLSAQIAPMKDLAWIDMLKEAGLNSLSFNMEIWDDALRNKIMPGKAQIPRELYLDCLEYAGKVFGAANVSSWLIGGLEAPGSTITGAEEIAKRGVIPFVTVFRPIMGSPLENSPPPDFCVISHIYSKLKNILGKYGLDPRKGTCGCSKCDCCAAGGDALSHGV